VELMWEYYTKTICVILANKELCDEDWNYGKVYGKI
jgi:hypothetical protein